MENYRESTNKDQLRVIIYFALAVLLIIVSGVVAAPIIETAGIIVWIFFTAAAVMFTYFRLHAANTIYMCPECCRHFKISTWQDFTSPNSSKGKFLYCPNCKHRVWAKEFVKKIRQ